jgi:hypothetical protein
VRLVEKKGILLERIINKEACIAASLFVNGSGNRSLEDVAYGKGTIAIVTPPAEEVERRLDINTDRERNFSEHILQAQDAVDADSGSGTTVAIIPAAIRPVFAILTIASRPVAVVVEANVSTYAIEYIQAPSAANGFLPFIQASDAGAAVVPAGAQDALDGRIAFYKMLYGDAAFPAAKAQADAGVVAGAGAAGRFGVAASVVVIVVAGIPVVVAGSVVIIVVVGSGLFVFVIRNMFGRYIAGFAVVANFIPFAITFVYDVNVGTGRDRGHYGGITVRLAAHVQALIGSGPVGLGKQACAQQSKNQGK